MLEPSAVLKPWKGFTVRIAGRRRRFVRVDMGRWWVSGKKSPLRKRSLVNKNEQVLYVNSLNSYRDVGGLICEW